MDFDFSPFEPENLTLHPLFRSLQQQKCILILGPNLATAQMGGQTLPISDCFAMVLTNHLKKQNIHFDNDEVQNLQYISLRWLRGMRGVRDIDLRAGFQKFYRQGTTKVPTIYEKLAQLPFFLVVNTNHDDFIKQAFEGVGKQPNLLHYNYKRNQSAPVKMRIGAKSPLVYNLFGYHSDIESMVITQEDQIDFVKGTLSNVSTIPKGLLSHFDNEKTYLFLGFDPEAWHLPLLFRSLRLDQDSSTFYVWPKGTDEMLLDTFQDIFNFQFINEPTDQFLDNFSTGFADWQKEHQANHPPVSTETTYIEDPFAGLSGNAKVLMLTSNPKDAETLELEKEINMVEAALENAPQGEMFELKPILNINKRRLLPVLLRHRPRVVHFSGHGVGKSGLLFYDNDGYADMVAGQELAALFEQFSDTISCVVLNACYSQEQAQIIANHIPNVIGTDNAIGDEVALVFASGFYMALFAGETYEKAFQMAMAHVGLEKFPAGGRPVFYKNGKLLAS